LLASVLRRRLAPSPSPLPARTESVISLACKLPRFQNSEVRLSMSCAIPGQGNALFRDGLNDGPKFGRQFWSSDVSCRRANLTLRYPRHCEPSHRSRTCCHFNGYPSTDAAVVPATPRAGRKRELGPADQRAPRPTKSGPGSEVEEIQHAGKAAQTTARAKSRVWHRWGIIRIIMHRDQRPLSTLKALLSPCSLCLMASLTSCGGSRKLSFSTADLDLMDDVDFSVRNGVATKTRR
jgi:hypothetical protein